jgi:hypothetical protein
MNFETPLWRTGRPTPLCPENLIRSLEPAVLSAKGGMLRYATIVPFHECSEDVDIDVAV